MAQDSIDIEKLLKSMNPQQALQLRTQFDQVLKSKGVPMPASNGSVPHAKTIAELEQLEANRIDLISVQISDSASHLAQPSEP